MVVPQCTPFTLEQRIERFWSRVDKSGGDDACWPWTGGRLPQGYGLMGWDGHTRRSNRIAYELTYGPIPDGLLVCHACDNPPCCNPKHLWLGTHLDNARDKEAKGRGNQLSGDKHPRRLHPELYRNANQWMYTNPEKLARGKRSGAYTHPEKLPRGERHGLHLHPERAAHGERGGMAKLKDAFAIEIRRRFDEGGVSQSQLSREYGVTVQSIWAIVHRKTYKHLP